MLLVQITNDRVFCPNHLEYMLRFPDEVLFCGYSFDCLSYCLLDYGIKRCIVTPLLAQILADCRFSYLEESSDLSLGEAFFLELCGKCIPERWNDISYFNLLRINELLHILHNCEDVFKCYAFWEGNS